jgi:hypothetical protein
LGHSRSNRIIQASIRIPFEKLSFSIPVDGTVVAGSGIAVLLRDGGTVSDLLKVTVTPKTRGLNIPFFDASGTFTSDTDPGGWISRDWD